MSAPDASATSTAVTHPGLSIVKTVDVPTYDSVGDILTYDVTVTNTSNVRVHALTVSDPAPGDGTFDLDCGALPARLAPGDDEASCTATYAVTQTDLDNGSVVNTAQTSALLPTNQPVDSPTAGGIHSGSVSLADAGQDRGRERVRLRR